MVPNLEYNFQAWNITTYYPFFSQTALVSVSEFGKSLVEVQSMMKRHQLLEADVANHNTVVKALIEKGEQVRNMQ